MVCNFSNLGKVPSVACRFLETQGAKWLMAHVAPTGFQEFVQFLKALKDSAPGPDGIPYSCYKALIDTMAMLFFYANLILLQGGLLGEHFNSQRGCSIPKNSPPEGCDPRADELRTLGLKNTDNKAITLTNCAQFRDVVSDNTASIQRGFVGGRQFVFDIVDLDCFARAQANHNHFPSSPAWLIGTLKLPPLVLGTGGL